MEGDERTGSPPRKGGSRERSTLKTVGLLIALYLGAGALVVGAGAFVYRLFEPGRSRAFDAAVAGAVSRGFETDVDEYRKSLLALDPEENAATLYERVFPTVRSLWKVRKPDEKWWHLLKAQKFPPVETPVDEETLAAVREYLKPCRERNVFALLREAAEFRDCRYSIEWEGFETLLPHLTTARECARVLVLAAWLDALEGRPDEALAKIGDAAALARSLSGEPFPVSLLVQGTCASIAVKTGLPQVLARCRPSDEALRGLQEKLEAVAETISIDDALEGEVLTFVYLYNRAIEGDYGKLYLYYECYAAANSRQHQLTRFEKWKMRWRYGAHFAAKMGVVLRFFDNTREITPPVLQAPPSQYVTRTGPGEPFPSLEDYATQLRSVLVRSEEARATLLAGAAALAALRFQGEHGKWPENLEALVPEFITKVPVDPFSGEGLVYRVFEDGIAVYSVGVNGVDDGGKPGFVEAPEESAYDDRAGVRIRIVSAAAVQE
ncbi:MAG: hypothetical protein ACYTAN_08375 [Planctomycetota bacterium]